MVTTALQAGSAGDVLNSKQTAELLEVTRQHLSKLVAEGLLRPLRRRRGDGPRMYFRRDNVVACKKLRELTLSEMKNELIDRYLADGSVTPTPSSPAPRPRHLDSAAELTPGVQYGLAPTELSAQAVRDAFIQLGKQGLQDIDVQARRRGMHREPGEQLTQGETFQGGLSAISALLGKAFFVALVGFIATTDDSTLEQHWRTLLEQAPMNREVQALVDNICRIAMESGSATETVDPRQIKLFDQELPPAQDAAELVPRANGPPVRRRRRVPDERKVGAA
jgi:DNA-binding transcriptional MerR regulator